MTAPGKAQPNDDTVAQVVATQVGVVEIGADNQRPAEIGPAQVGMVEVTGNEPGACQSS